MLYNLLIRPISKLSLQGIAVVYSFYNFNANINHKFSGKGRLFLIAYFGNDRSIVRKKGRKPFKSTLEWGNNLAALRWSHLLSQNFSTT